MLACNQAIQAIAAINAANKQGAAVRQKNRIPGSDVLDGADRKAAGAEE
jgi:hypothetical protein